MSTPSGVPVTLRRRTTDALDDTRMRTAVRNTTDLLAAGRTRALDELVDADLARDEAAAIRRRTLRRLGDVLATWQREAEANGIVVHRAGDAVEARRIVTALLRRRADALGRPLLVVKGKSMASEEIHLNEAMEADGHAVVETDLGEFIIQLAGEPPSHLIAPAIHKDRYDVADLFTADAGRTVPPVVEDEAAYARVRLRQSFLDADVGITGVNFAIAETGSFCLVENEGNGRMSSSLPSMHIAVMGLERIVETWDDLDVMLSLLARSATGQSLSVYTNIISGPRRDGEVDGPDEVHVVVLDNGRSDLLGTEMEEALACIRCGACLNVCPVYRTIGGHAYASVYSGPIGAVLSPLLRNRDEAAAQLPEASTLCGACTDVCPVRIPLHDLLLRLRHRAAVQRPPQGRRGFAVWSRVWSSRRGYRISVALVRRTGPVAARRIRPGGWLARRAPGWLGAWVRHRALPAGDDRTGRR
jgi:L-lactate dehydrogenase complex protein LldF